MVRTTYDTCTHICTYTSSTVFQHSGAKIKSNSSKFILYNTCAVDMFWQSWTFVCLFSAPPGGEVWEANMEETGGGCGGPRRRQQLCSGPDNSKRAPWCVTIATLPYSISTSLVLDHVKCPSMSYTHSCDSLEAMCMSHPWSPFVPSHPNASPPPW